MTIDERARQAGASLRAITDQVDVDRSLDDLVVSVRRRNHLRTAAAVAASAIVVVGGLTLRGAVDRADAPPVTPPTPMQSADLCSQPFIHCQVGSRFTVLMQAPMTWTLPADFDPALRYRASAAGDRAVSVEAYRSNQHDAGVTVAQHAFAARIRVGESTTVVPNRRLTPGAHVLATWVAQRPYLIASDVTETTVGGLRAWTVQVRLRDPNRPGLSACTFTCTPILSIADTPYDQILGIWAPMVSRYTLVDADRGGTTAIWSSSFVGAKALNGNLALIDSIRFEPS